MANKVLALKIKPAMSVVMKDLKQNMRNKMKGMTSYLMRLSPVIALLVVLAVITGLSSVLFYIIKMLFGIIFGVPFLILIVMIALVCCIALPNTTALLAKRLTKKALVLAGIEAPEINTIKIPSKLKKQAAEQAPTPPKRLVIDEKYLQSFQDIVHGGSSRYDFLSQYEAVNSLYKEIKRLNKTIQDSSMTANQKASADELLGFTEKTIDTLRSLHNIGSVSLNHTYTATNKLEEINAGMTELIGIYTSHVASEFSSIKIPIINHRRHELEALRVKGESLLNEIKDDPSFESFEGKIRLSKIVNGELDKVWGDYVVAKSNLPVIATDSLLSINRVKTYDPDAVLDDVFNSIRNIYSEVESDINGYKTSVGISELVKSKNYLETR